MAIAWYICQYKLKPNRPNMRYCAMDDFTSLIITQDSGNWAESEVLGAYAVVKVRASDATLTIIAGTANFQRIPNWINLTDTLGSLTTAQRTAILNKILAMGYTLAEIEAALGGTLASWRTKTLGQVLRFAAQRRLLCRWDDVQKQIVLDGASVSCEPIDNVDVKVQ